MVIHCNSQVVTNQVNGEYECKGERIKKYLEQVKRRVDDLQAKIIQIPRGENEQADHLSFVQFSPLIDPIDVQEIGFGSN